MIDAQNRYDAEQKRLAFQNLFVHHPDGALVLAVIRNRLGVNCPDPERINPDLIALDYWLMNMIGIQHEQNVMDVTRALLDTANDNDLIEAYKDAKESEDVKDV